jgi:hypothetical protein
MDEHLQLAESYYTVARHLKGQADHMLEIAELLNTAADQICEREMRRKQPPSDRANPQQPEIQQPEIK